MATVLCRNGKRIQAWHTEMSIATEHPAGSWMLCQAHFIPHWQTLRFFDQYMLKITYLKIWGYKCLGYF